MSKTPFTMRLDDGLKLMATWAAEQDGRKLTAWIEQSMFEKLERDGHFKRGESGWTGDSTDPKQKLLAAIRAKAPDSKQLPENK